jgi:hypothetical protein
VWWHGTGAVIRSESGDMILTVAHNLFFDPGSFDPGGFATEGRFIPGVWSRGLGHELNAPYSEWQVYAMAVPVGYSKEPGYPRSPDVGVALVRPRDGQHIQDVVGGQDLAFGVPRERQQVYQLGYPSSPQPIWNGTVRVAGRGSLTSTRPPGRARSSRYTRRAILAGPRKGSSGAIRRSAWPRPWTG